MVGISILGLSSPSLKKIRASPVWVEECRHGTGRGLTGETEKTVGRHSNKDLSLGLAHEPVMEEL